MSTLGLAPADALDLDDSSMDEVNDLYEVVGGRREEVSPMSA